MFTKRIESPELLELIKKGDDFYSKTQYTEAVQMYKQVYDAIDDSFAYDKCEMCYKLGNSYYGCSDFENARILYEKSLQFNQSSAYTYNLLGYFYFFIDKDKCCEYYLKAMELEPNFDNFVMLTQLMIKLKKYSQKDLKEIFEKYVDYFRPQILNGDTPYSYSTERKIKNKKLKIGYLSSDFMCHAMMHFVLPILENHDKEKFDVVLYSCGKNQDTTTERIKNIGFKFVDCSEMTNKQRAELIHKDNIDILVDLSGYTHNAIWSFLYKPAPIQAQFLGFLGTYGIKEVDYILTDKFTIPENIAPYYTETPMYIDCGMNRFSFHTVGMMIPNITPLPYETNGYITFGSFNCLSKLNKYTLSLWSRLLKTVPNSKLLIYRTQMTENDINLLKTVFLENEISEERLIFSNSTAKTSYLEVYANCDIALDPSPFSGLTITIEQIMMGTPVMTLNGETIASKGTPRINKMLGLDDFVAETEDEFINKASALANNIEKLRWYRYNLRNILLSSALFTDHKNYAQSIEKEYEKAWEKFCNE